MEEKKSSAKGGEKNQTNSITESLHWLKEHYYVIGSVPLVLGGMLQFLRLKDFGVNYTRFFSVTQLLSDGLIFLFVLGAFYLLYRFSKLVYNWLRGVETLEYIKVFLFIIVIIESILVMDLSQRWEGLIVFNQILYLISVGSVITFLIISLLIINFGKIGKLKNWLREC